MESRVRTLRIQELGLGQGLAQAGSVGRRHLESVRLKIGSKPGGRLQSVWSAGHM